MRQPYAAVVPVSAKNEFGGRMCCSYSMDIYPCFFQALLALRRTPSPETGSLWLVMNYPAELDAEIALFGTADGDLFDIPVRTTQQAYYNSNGSMPVPPKFNRYKALRENSCRTVGLWA
jgi:hypothetical protein